MRVHSSTRFAAMAVLIGALACAGNKAETESDETAAARDTTTSDTLGGQAQNQPGDRGMERDSVNAPQYPETSDTFLQNQGPGQGRDTAGYSGMERADTTGQANPSGQTDTTGAAPRDTSSTMGTDTTSSMGTDTTGYQPQQQPGDTTR